MQSPKNILTHIVKSHFEIHDGWLRINGMLLKDIVDRYGTPLYVYDTSIFKKKLALLRNALPDVEIHYSVKANPTPAVIKTFVDEGCGLEIASAGELVLAQKCGCSPSRILYAGPGKTESDLIDALQAGVSEIHIESFEEIGLLSKIAGRFQSEFSVAIRINPSDVIKGGAMVMGAKATAFGIDEELLFQAIDRVRETGNLNLCGLHCYAGTQIIDYDILVDMYEHYIRLAARMAEYSGKPLKTLDFGGGFGIPYFDSDKDLEMDKLHKHLTPVFKEARTTKYLKPTKFIVEPGRYLVAEAGLYITRILYCKSSHDKKIIILDGGMNHNVAATGHFGQIIKRNFPMALGNKMDKDAKVTYTVAGPLCTPLDTLGRDVLLPAAESGDIMVFFQSGAYARSASPLQFLGHPEPMEVFVSDSDSAVVRHRGDAADLLRGTEFDNNLI